VAAAITPAPLPASESVDQTHEGSGIIPGDRPEFPLPTLDDKHRFLATPGSIDRPRTPPELSFEDSRALLTRLTGLQPWQLEAFPDELPPLPLSRPSSPLRSPSPSVERGRPTNQQLQRRLSTTAVPIRFRKPPGSPVAQRDLAVEPESLIASPGSSPLRPRHGKAPSSEFKASREFRPLYLLELLDRKRKSDEIDEVLPALPASGSPSLASATDTETEAEYESALESPRPSDSVTPDDAFFAPFDVVSDLISSQPGPELQHPELVDREIEEIDHSGQVTPKASDFTAGVTSESAGPARDVLTAALEDVKAKDRDLSFEEDVVARPTSPRPATPLAPSAPLDDTKMRDISTPGSRDASPAKSSSRLQTAAFGAAIGGLTAAALRNRSQSPSREAKAAEPTPDTSADVKGKGKAKKKKGKKGSISESMVSTLVGEPQEHDPKQFVPTFNDNEENWAKNKSGSVVTDDATLVGEPVAASKGVQAEKVLESTKPQESEDVEVRRAVFGSDKPQGDLSRELESLDQTKHVDAPISEAGQAPADIVAPKEDLEKTLADIKPKQDTLPVLEEQAAASSSKAKKIKKSKKGKRGSQQLEPEPESITLKDEVLPAPETQQEVIEREILEPSFPEAKEEKKVDVMDFLEKDDQKIAPVAEEQVREVMPEHSTSTQTQKDTAPEISIADPIVSVPEQPSSPPKPAEAPVQERPTSQSSESSKSGWGSSWLGAIGWGKKRATSPTPVVTPKPVVEEKKEIPIVAPVEAKPTEAKRKSAILEQLELARKAKMTASDPVVEEKKEAESAKPKPTEVTRDVAAPTLPDQLESERQRPAFVAPQTAYFADDGKPSFTFPAFKPTLKEESAPLAVDNTVTEKAVEDAQPQTKNDAVKEAKPAFVMPQASYFADDGKPHFTFPQQVAEKLPIDTVSSERALDDGAAAVLPVPKEVRPAFVVPQTSYFADDGKPHFSFPQVPTQPILEATPESTSTVVDEEVDMAEQAPVTKKKTKKDKKKRGSVVAPASESVEPETTAATDASIAESSNVQVEQHSDDLVKDTPAADEAAVLLRGAEPDVVPIEELSRNIPTDAFAIPEPTGPIIATPVEDVTPKKKGKEARKAKRESEPSTPITERSIDLPTVGPSDDTGFDVPLPLETAQEVEELVERVAEMPSIAPHSETATTVTEAAHKPIAGVQDVVAEPIQDVQVEASREIADAAQEDWGFTPKTKKAKKSRTKSGVQTPEVQAEPVVEQTTQLDQPSVSEVIDAPLAEARPLVETERSLEVDPTSELAAAVEQEPASILSKKDKKKKKGKKTKGTETPVEDVVQPESSTTLEPVVEQVARPEDIELPDVVEGELEEAPVLEVKDQDNASVLVQPETETRNISEPIAKPAFVAQPEDIELPDVVEGELEEAPVLEVKDQDNASVLVQPETETRNISEPIAKPTFVAPQASFFTDNGKPHFTFPQVSTQTPDAISTEPIQDNTPAVAQLETEAVDISARSTTPAFVAPQTSFFTDNGKPHFTFPQQSTTSTAAVSSEPIQADIIPAIEEQPAPVAADQPATSKKDKKKKKGKKSKAVEESEPNTPVAEVQQELGAPVEREIEVSEQVVDEVKQPEAVVEEQPVLAAERVSVPVLNEPELSGAVVEDQALLAPQPSEPVINASTPTLNDSVQLPTLVQEEPSTPSKKSKKKKGKKDKGVDLEASVAEASIVEEQTLPEPSVEPSVAEYANEYAPTRSLEEPQEIPLPIEIPGELAQDATSREVGETVAEPIIEETVPIKPSLEEPIVEEPIVEEPIVEEPIVEEPITEEPSTTSKKDKKKKGKKNKSIDIGPSTIDVPAVTTETEPPVDTVTAEPTIVAPPTSALESVLETLAPSTEVAQAHVTKPTTEGASPEDTTHAPDTSSREIVGPIVEEEPTTTSKKSKKKKGKKGVAIDTEPSTPVTEQSAIRFDEPAETEKTELVSEPAKELPSSDVPAITTETVEPARVDESVDVTPSVSVGEPVQTERSMDIAPSVAVEPAQDTAISTALEPTIENTDAELTSKKAKKKKGKKAKSTDVTEPSTPITEEGKQLELRLESATADKSIDVTQQATEEPAAELPKEPATTEPVSKGFSDVKEEESTVLPAINDPIQEATEPSASLEQAVETESSEVSSKKAKKKKGKKAKADEDQEVESTSATIEDVSATDTMLDTKPIEEPMQIPESTSVEAPAESSTTVNDSVPASTTELPAERELVTESPAVEVQAAFEPAILEEATTTTQLEAPIDNDEASSTSKKAKKKKSKKNKSISEPQTPTTEVESFIPPTGATDDIEATATQAQEPVVQKEDAEVEPEVVPHSIETQTTEQATTQSDDTVAAIEDLSRDIELPSVVPEQSTEQVEESTTEALVSKKEKKKAKKSKRVSIVEESSSTPATPVEELPRELESQEIAAGVALPEDSTISQPVSPKTKPADVSQLETALPTTLDDSSASQPPIVRENESSVADQGVPAQQAESVVSEPEQVQPVEDDTTTSKKGKKKAKKEKRKSVTEDEPSTPLETLTTELEIASFNEQPLSVPEVLGESSREAVSTSVDFEPAPTVQGPEESRDLVTEVLQEQPISQPTATKEPEQAEMVADEETATLSKKDKKKAKKNKRVSIAEPESTPATPVEDKPAFLEDQPVPVTQLSEPAQDEAVSSSVDVQPATSSVVVEEPKDVAINTPLEEQVQPITAIADEAQHPQEDNSISISKKDKKKAKKAKRVSIAEPESTPATPVEEKTEPELFIQEAAPVAAEQPASDVLPTEEPVSKEIAADELVAAPPATEVIPTEEESTTSLSKKDKKKAKKAKSGTATPVEETLEVAEGPVVKETLEPVIVAPLPEEAPKEQVLDTLVVEEKEIETPAVEEPVTVEELPKVVPEEETAPTSKKDKKKKKAAKRGSIAGSEASEPVAPIEQLIEETKEVPAADQSIAAPSNIDEPTLVTETAEPQLPEPAAEQTGDIAKEDQSLATPLVVEEPIIAALEENPKDSVQEEASSAPLSKKDKKKGKKAKRGSIAELEPSASTETSTRDISAADEQIITPMVVEKPAATVPVSEPEVSLPVADAPIAKMDEIKDEQQIVAPTSETPTVPVDEKALPLTSTAEVATPSDIAEPALNQTTTDAAVPVTEDAEPAEWANLSKAQKKKAKKAKRGSIAEGEPSQPATPAEELQRELTLEVEPAVIQVVDEPSIAVQQPEVLPTAVEAPAEVVEESSAKSKKDKKKKKSKSVSILEDEPSQPATPIEEVTKELGSEPHPAIEDLTSEPKLAEEEPTTVTKVEEAAVESTPAVEDSASTALSKKDKKKAKKAKRTSGIDESSSQPATPIEEVTRELVSEPQPGPADIPSQERSLATDDIPPDLPDTGPAEPSTPSKKDKKKAKKGKTTATEPVPFLAHETSEEANVSETQPSPFPPSKPSENQNLLLSGIPTSYPHVSDSAFVVSDGGGDVRDVKEENVVEVEMKKEEENEKKEESGVIDGGKVAEAEAAVDVGDVKPLEQTATQLEEPVVEPPVAQSEVILLEQPTAQVDTPTIQPAELQPIEEVKVVPEEHTTTLPAKPEEKTAAPIEPTTAIPAQPEEKKVKKHKLAALFEQKAAEDKPVLPRKRAPWAKPASMVETVGESSKSVAAEEKAEAKEELALPKDAVVETLAPEPIVEVGETKKDSEEIAQSRDVASETPALEPPVTVDETLKPSEEIVPAQDVAVETHAPEPIPAQSTERSLDVATEQPSVPFADVQPPLEAVPEVESSLLGKKDKKKSKENKRQSGTATPAETVPEVPVAPLEEVITTKTEAEPEVTTSAEREVPVELQEPQLEIPKISDNVHVPEAASMEPHVLITEEAQETPVEVEAAIEPQVSVSDTLVDAPSKKDKKKSKKAKKQSGSATPAEEIVPEVQQEKNEERAVPDIEQPITESVTDTAPALEEASELVTTDKIIEPSQEETLPVTAEPIVETSQQENVQPAVAAPIEAAQPIGEDSSVKLSKKDKKKGKKAKKQSEPATPVTENLPEIAQEEIKEVAIESLDQPATEPIVESETLGEKATEPLAQDLPPTVIEEPTETSRTDNVLPVAADIAPDIPESLPTTSDANVEPSQAAEEDWGYTPPKKDKKKSKKGKKADTETASAEFTPEVPRETIESKAEPVPEIIEQSQPSVYSTDVSNKAPVDITEAGPLPDTSVPVLKTDDTLDKAPQSERALDATTTDIIETTPLPIPSAESATPFEEETAAPISKKDKKKGKKAKKASGTATSITEEVPVVQPETTQELSNAEGRVPEKTAEELPIDVVGKEPVVEELRELEQAEPISALIAETEPLIDETTLLVPATSKQEPESSTTDPKEIILDDTPIVAAREAPIVEESQEVEQPLQESASVEPVLEEPASPSVSKKKSKKKGKKSGLATPITEDAFVPELGLTNETNIKSEPVIADKAPIGEIETIATSIIDDAPAPQVETPQDPEIKPGPHSDLLTEHTIIDKAPLVEEVPTPATQSEPIVEEQLSTPSASQDAPIETVIGEQTLPSTSKKSKKKSKKSGTATLLVDDAPVPQLEPAEEPTATTTTETVAVPTPEVEDVVAEANRDLPEIEAPVTPAVTESEPVVDEAPVPMPSKKSKKKGKKSGSATPVAEDIPQILSEDVLPPVEESSIADREVVAPTEPIVEEPAKQDSVPATTEILPVPKLEEVVVVPIEAKDKEIMAPEQPPTIEPPTEDVTASSSSKKKKGKKNKSKQSEPSTPAIELSNPIDTVARTISEDVQQIPVADKEIQPPILEPTTAADVVPLETTEEVTVVEKPSLERKLSKKEKRAQEKALAAAMDKEPVVEVAPQIENVVETAPAPEVVEPVLVEEPQQMSLIEEAQAPAPFAEAEVARDTPEQASVLVGEPATKPTDDQTLAQDDMVSAPAKGKKAKKDKKKKTQSISLDPVESAESKVSETIEQFQDDKPVLEQPAQPTESHAEASTTRDMELSLPAPIENALTAPEEVIPAHTPSTQVQDFAEREVEQQVEQQVAHEPPVLNVQPQALETSDSLVTEEADNATPISRKASKKSKKGKKDKDVVSEPPVVDQLVETPAIIETIRDLPLDIPARVEEFDTPILVEASRQEQPSEPTAIDLPAYEQAVEVVPQLIATEHASVPPTAEPVIENIVQAQAPENVRPIEGDGDATSSKVSKKDKKKGKKSKSTSGIATPIEAVPEPTVVSENIISDHAEPTVIDEPPHNTQLDEPKVTATELPDAQALPEVTHTPVIETVQEATISIQEPSVEPQQQPIETVEQDMSLSSSKKSKKKKDKKTETAAKEIEAGPSMVPTLVSEAPSEIVQESLEVLPMIAEATLDAKRSPSPPAFETAQPLPEIESLPTEILLDTAEHSHEQQEKTEEKVQPPVVLSPDLKAVQDEAADLKLRSEALDQALTASEQLDEPFPSEPQSMFDIVGKLSKKDKKKGKKAKGTVIDSEPTTPAAEPEAVVETKEIVEEQILAEVPSPKLSKKDKKKARQSSVSWEEPSERSVGEPVVVERQEPIVEPVQTDADTITETTTSQSITQPEAPVVSVEEVMPTPLEEPIAPIENVASAQPIELQEPTVEEPPTLVRKLSKKDKKKAKQIAQEDDVPVSQPETILPDTLVETRDITTTEELQSAPVAEATDMPTSVPESQETVIEEERPSMSRKLSKKDKKKQAKTAFLAEDQSMVEPQVTLPETTTELREVTMSEEPSTAEPAPTAEELIIPAVVLGAAAAAEERPLLSRKQSKKDKNKGKQAQIITDGLVESVHDTPPLSVVQKPTLETPVIEDPEVQDTAHDSVTSKPVIETTVTEQTTEPVTHVKPFEPTTSRELQIDSGSIATIEDESSTPVLAEKQSKKDKKKGKKSILVDESIESTSEPDVKTRDVEKPAETPVDVQQPIAMEMPTAAHAPIDITPDAPATTILEEIPKKQKRKSKTTAALSETPIEESHTSTSRELFAEPVLPEKPVEEERVLPAKKSKKEKGTSKAAIASDVLPPKKPAFTSRDAMQEDPFTSSTREVVEESKMKPHVVNAFDDSSAREPPILNKKPSRTHKLAAMFEQGGSQGDLTAGRELRKGGNGSVKNLAEQYETQSRSTTPVLQPAHKRSLTRLASDIRQDSQSPKKDIDFAGTLAAGLKLSGFNDEYVVNDPNFHQSASPHGSRDITTEDDVEAALNSASTSKFAKKGWTTPTSSPKLRPRKEPESTTLPPIEVAMTATDAISFDPLDVLNDPTFAKQSATPRALEEADPDELGSKLKMNKKSKGKKKRASVPESPIEADQQPTILQEDYDNVTLRKSKSRKDKQRASQTLDSVETAAETPVVEAFTNEPPAVETRAIDSTVRGSKLEETLPSPSGVARIDRSFMDEETTVPISGKELGEYPFPQVLVPDNVATRSMEEKPVEMRQEEQEGLDQVAKSSKKKERRSKVPKEEVGQVEESSIKKEKKSKRVKESKEKSVEAERSHDGPSLAQDTTTHETHKRRSHPVTFEEAQPYEKRPHLQEPMPETHPTDAGPRSAPEPSWSFAGVRESAVEVTDLPIEASAPSFPDITRDSNREKKRRSKESSRRATESTDKDVSESSETTEKRHSKSREEQPVEIEQKEPYKSIFGDPSEKSAGPSAHPITPASKHGRSLSNKQLDTITETSPEDQHLHKKGRAITDVGAPERGTKSLRRADSLKHMERTNSPTLGTPTPSLRRAASPNPMERLNSPQLATSSPPLRRAASPQLIERMRSPVPVTPAPQSRKATSTAADKSPSRSSPLTEGPLHQMNDKVDRTMTLSPARRLPRSSPSTSFDPVKQQMGEHRSPSVASQRSMSNISRFRTPDQERPPSAASVRSTSNLRRTERSISGDLRAVARLGEANAQDANEGEPNLSGIALAAGASAAIAGIAGASSYDPVRGAGKGRTASMVAETFVSVPS
jgi:hypothetical protein